MASQNQGQSTVPLGSVYQPINLWSNPAYAVRQSATLTANSAGSGNTTGKFYAWTQTLVFGATFCPTAIATSTYTVNGTATTSCQALYAVFVTNTSTSATIALATTTLGAAASGPFFISGTGTPGTNVSVQGQGGLGGYYRYALNTLGGTNTSQVWGTLTYSSPEAGGLYMNPGDSLQFVNGTDATGTVIPIVEYAICNAQSGTFTGTVLSG